MLAPISREVGTHEGIAAEPKGTGGARRPRSQGRVV